LSQELTRQLGRSAWLAQVPRCKLSALALAFWPRNVHPQVAAIFDHADHHYGRAAGLRVGRGCGPNQQANAPEAKLFHGANFRWAGGERMKNGEPGPFL
jgi:hypothetical protein